MAVRRETASRGLKGLSRPQQTHPHPQKNPTRPLKVGAAPNTLRWGMDINKQVD